MSKGTPKVVVAYSGGLDTSVIITWLKERSDVDVIAFTADVGQGEELDPLEEKAQKTGASKLIIDDLREEFVRDFVFPALRANAVYEGCYLLGTSLARPLIAKRLVEHARAEGAASICHGATGKGNDQVRFEMNAYALHPEIKVIAPWREWDMKGRSDLVAYCKDRKIPITVTAEKPYSMDRNLFHCSFEGGILEDPWNEPNDDMFVMSVSPEAAPDKAQYVEIEFEKGTPVAIDGEKLSPANLLAKANELAGAHGIGRVDIVENRFVGMKSRGVYETPGGTLLHEAHRGVEQLTMDREVMFLRDALVPKYAQLIYNGFWYAPERELMQTMIDAANEPVTGVARVKMYKGQASLVGRKASKSLYSSEHASFEADDVYNQGDADGFIKLNALRLRLRNQLGF